MFRNASFHLTAAPVAGSKRKNVSRWESRAVSVNSFSLLRFSSACVRSITSRSSSSIAVWRFPVMLLKTRVSCPTSSFERTSTRALRSPSPIVSAALVSFFSELETDLVMKSPSTIATIVTPSRTYNALCLSEDTGARTSFMSCWTTRTHPSPS